MSDLLNHLVRWMSDGLRPGFRDDVPVHSRSSLGPQDTQVQGPTVGVAPSPWRRANRSSARARHGAASPPRPWVSYRRAISSYRVASEYGFSSRAIISTDSSRCASAFVQSPRFANTRPRFALAVDRATGSPIVSASRTARSALAAAASTDPSRRKLSTAFASAYDAKRTSPAPRAISADRANVSAAVRVSPSRLETIPRLIWIAASSLVPLRTDEAASRRRAFARAWSPRAIRTAPRSVSARTRSREPWGKRSAARSRCPMAAGRSPSFRSTPPRARNASPSTSGTASAEASRTASARIVRASAYDASRLAIRPSWMCARRRSAGVPDFAIRSRTARASENFPRNICVSARRASSLESCGARSRGASRSPARALSANAGPTSTRRATAAPRSPDSIRWYASARTSCRLAQYEAARTCASRRGRSPIRRRKNSFTRSCNRYPSSRWCRSARRTSRRSCERVAPKLSGERAGRRKTANVRRRSSEASSRSSRTVSRTYRSVSTAPASRPLAAKSSRARGCPPVAATTRGTSSGSREAPRDASSSAADSSSRPSRRSSTTRPRATSGGSKNVGCVRIATRILASGGCSTTARRRASAAGLAWRSSIARTQPARSSRRTAIASIGSYAGRDRGRLDRLRSRQFDDVGGEDPLDRLGLPQARVAQRVDRLGPKDGATTFRRRQLDCAGARVLPHPPRNLLARGRQLVHLPTGAGVRDMGHPLLHLARRLESLQLERDVRSAQQEGVRDPILGHLHGAFVRFRVTQKSGEVDENSLSHGDTRHSLRPSDADIGASLLNRVGRRCDFPPFLRAAAGTSGRSTVPGQPLDDRRQLVQVARFGVRRRVGGTPTKVGAVDPHGLHPEARGALHVCNQRVSHMDHVVRSDPKGFEGRFEDPRARLVRLRRL